MVVRCGISWTPGVGSARWANSEELISSWSMLIWSGIHQCLNISLSKGRRKNSYSLDAQCSEPRAPLSAGAGRGESGFREEKKTIKTAKTISKTKMGSGGFFRRTNNIIEKGIKRNNKRGVGDKQTREGVGKI